MSGVLDFNLQTNNRSGYMPPKTDSPLRSKMPIFNSEVFSSGSDGGLAGSACGIAQLRKSSRCWKLNTIQSSHSNKTKMSHFLRRGSMFLHPKNATSRPGNSPTTHRARTLTSES